VSRTEFITPFPISSKAEVMQIMLSFVVKFEITAITAEKNTIEMHTAARAFADNMIALEKLIPVFSELIIILSLFLKRMIIVVIIPGIHERLHIIIPMLLLRNSSPPITQMQKAGDVQESAGNRALASFFDISLLSCRLSVIIAPIGLPQSREARRAIRRDVCRLLVWRLCAIKLESKVYGSNIGITLFAAMAMLALHASETLPLAESISIQITHAVRQIVVAALLSFVMIFILPSYISKELYEKRDEIELNEKRF